MSQKFRVRAERSMLFNGNDDLGDTLNETPNSDDFFESCGEASADFPLSVLLDDVGHAFNVLQGFAGFLETLGYHAKIALPRCCETG